MLFVWENLVLHWQVHPRTVDEVDDGESILEGNLLGSKVFLASDGKPSTGFDGGVVGHDQTWLTVNASKFNDDPPRRTAALVLVHPMSRECANLQPF